jgi:hypothetical protein
MNIGVLRTLHEARPFVPFTIAMADGRKLHVVHNEFLSFFPSGRAVMLTHDDDRFTLIDLPMITAVDVDPKYRTRQTEEPAES